MPDDEIKVPAGLTTEGLLGKRYIARLIDSIVILLLIGLVAGLAAALSPGKGMTAASLAVILPIPIVWIGYGATLESSAWQATVGKRFMGLRVYNSEGGRIRWLQAAGRNLVKDGPFLLFGLFPGAQLLSLLWLGAHLFVMHRSPVYQAIHDRAAHTWVAASEGTIQLHLT